MTEKKIVKESEASILTKLFNRRIKLKVLSGLFKRYKTLFADLLPFLYLCFNLYLLTLINEVSEPEKKADKKRSNTSSMNKFSIVRVCIYLKLLKYHLIITARKTV